MFCHSQSIETRFYILDYLYLPLLPFDILCTQPYPSPLDAGLCNLLDCQLNCQPRNSPIENTGTHTWLSIEQTPARLGPSMSIDLVHNDHKNRRDDHYTDQTNERVSKIEPIIVLERCQQVATLRSKDQVAWVHIFNLLRLFNNNTTIPIECTRRADSAVPDGDTPCLGQCCTCIA